MYWMNWTAVWILWPELCMCLLDYHGCLETPSRRYLAAFQWRTSLCECKPVFFLGPKKGWKGCDSLLVFWASPLLAYSFLKWSSEPSPAVRCWEVWWFDSSYPAGVCGRGTALPSTSAPSQPARARLLCRAVTADLKSPAIHSWLQLLCFFFLIFLFSPTLSSVSRLLITHQLPSPLQYWSWDHVALEILSPAYYLVLWCLIMVNFKEAICKFLCLCSLNLFFCFAFL